jgi:homoserine O-acetyltransferase
VGPALARVRAAATVVAVDSDRLYPPRLQEELVALLPGRPRLGVVTSPFGHDAFLVEADQVARFVAAALGR